MWRNISLGHVPWKYFGFSSHNDISSTKLEVKMLKNVSKFWFFPSLFLGFYIYTFGLVWSEIGVVFLRWGMISVCGERSLPHTSLYLWTTPMRNFSLRGSKGSHVWVKLLGHSVSPEPADFQSPSCCLVYVTKAQMSAQSKNEEDLQKVFFKKASRRPLLPSHAG